MLKKLKFYIRKLRKKEDNNLARPTTVKLEEGEIIFKNVPKEKKEALVNLLTLASEGHTSVNEGPEESTQQENKQPSYTETAFGLRQNTDNTWEVVTVKYDASSDSAIVQSRKNHGKDRTVAVGELKVSIAQTLL